MRGAYVAYSPELAGRVCALIGEGQSLSQVGRTAGLPAFTTLLRWRKTHPDFEAMYQDACARRAAPWPGPRGAYGTKAQIAARRAARREPGPPGRPSAFTDELADEICRRVAAGASTLDLADDPEMPASVSLFRWLKDRADFREAWIAACEQRAHTLADEIVEIADDASEDFIPARDGKGVVPNLQAIRRARLMIDARKWRAAKLAPRKYGWKPEGEPEDRPLTHEEILMQLD